MAWGRYFGLLFGVAACGRSPLDQGDGPDAARDIVELAAPRDRPAPRDIARTDATPTDYVDAAPAVDAADVPAPMDVRDAGSTDADAAVDPLRLVAPPRCDEAARCGGACRDLANDDAHCGRCGLACTRGTACSGGVCVAVRCTDTPAGCCTQVCPRGTTCDVDPYAGLMCGCGGNRNLSYYAGIGCLGEERGPGFSTWCQEQGFACGSTGYDCGDPAWSTRHCGRCNRQCENNESCVAGECVCPADAVRCGQRCTSVRVDRANCGACGRACGAGEVCVEGRCASNCARRDAGSSTCVCPPGWADCNGDGADGCEAYLPDDGSHCGACGRSCAVQNGHAWCDEGRCALYACPLGTTDCDGVAENGCEVVIAADRANCGVCGRRCAQGQQCARGACVTPNADPRDPVVALSAAERHTCAAHASGLVRCWGENDRGQLGDGTTLTRATPVRAVEFAGAVTVVAGTNHTCALLRDETLRCWGADYYGECGSPPPQNFGGTVLKAVRPALERVQQVALGTWHTCALVASGRVFCFGDNSSGQLGGFGDAWSVEPVEVEGLDEVVQIEAAGAATCARRRDGTVWCWGSNANRALGREPAAVPTSWRALPVPWVRDAEDLAMNGYTACARLRAEGVRCWTSSSNTPTALTPPPIPVVEAVPPRALGTRHACTLARDASVWCWSYARDPWQARSILGAGNLSRDPGPVRVSW